MRFLLILILALTATATAADKINTLAIIVNNDGITRLEIERLADKLMQRADSAGETLDEAAARRRAADSLILRALQLQRARNSGVQIPDAMVEQRLAGLRERLNVSDNVALRGAVRDNFGLSWDDFYRGLLEDLQIEAIFYREVFGKTDVYEKDVEEFLNTESGLFGEREYRLRHLRIDGDGEKAAAEIDDLRKRILEKGESFALLARAHSSADDAEENGDLGWKTLNQLPAAFTPAILKMTPGDVSEAIETARGFHLLQLMDVRGGGSGDSVSQVHLSHIFLDLNEEELADDLHSRLSAGEDFSALAKRYSRDEESADKDGVIGWFPVSGLPDYFAPVLDMETGETGTPLESPFGIHLVRVNQRQEIDMDDAREMAREILRERRALAQREEWLQKLRDRAYIIVVDPEFGGLNDG